MIKFLSKRTNVDLELRKPLRKVSHILTDVQEADSEANVSQDLVLSEVRSRQESLVRSRFQTLGQLPLADLAEGHPDEIQEENRFDQKSDSDSRSSQDRGNARIQREIDGDLSSRESKDLFDANLPVKNAKGLPSSNIQSETKDACRRLSSILLLNPLSMGFGKRQTGFGANSLGIKVDDSSTRRRASEMPNQGVIETHQMLYNYDYKIGVLPVDGENVIEGLRSNDSLANSWKSQEDFQGKSRNNSMDNIEINFNQDFNPNSDDGSQKGN